MKTRITTLACIVCLGAAAVSAKSPVRCLSSTSLGVEYISIWRGQTITREEVRSHEQIHQLALNYAPFEYFQLLIGLGMDRFRVDMHNQKQFKGNYGFSFGAGGYVNTPAVKVRGRDFLRITGGCDILFLNSQDDDHFKYSGPILNPHAGLLATIGPYLDMEAGVRWHFFDGKTDNTDSAKESSFSNNEKIREYFAMTLVSNSGAYARFYCDFSKEISWKWENGPSEASIGLAVGFVLKSPSRPDKSNMENNKYFPEYENMKKKQEDMIEELEE